MCATCGCDSAVAGQNHPHSEKHPHIRGPRTVRLEQGILAKNDSLASRNREQLQSRSIAAFNFVSSPGSGKTTLLEKTIRRLSSRISIAAIEGDQETERDAERLRATGCPVVQINTGAGCHLDAEMVANGLANLAPADHSLLLIENVGNLVCPALFDLGEQSKIVVMSVAEGEDKPLKYPHMFRASSVMLVNKIDLLPYVEFNVERCVAYARQANPKLQVFELSATRGDGMDKWCDWLFAQVPQQQPMRSAL